MATRKRVKSPYNNPFADIHHQFEDVRRDVRGVQKDVTDIKAMLGKHRKEEKDNGKRIDALTKITKEMARDLKTLASAK